MYKQFKCVLNWLFKSKMLVSLFTWISILCFSAIAAANTEGLQYFNCSSLLSDECPINAICSQLNESLVCICTKKFEWNYQWQLSANVSLDYCLTKNSTDEQDDEIKIYIRSPARKENVAIAILLVMGAALITISILYLLKVLKPLTRTKEVYVLLRNRRQNRHPLEEFEELDITYKEGEPQLFQRS